MHFSLNCEREICFAKNVHKLTKNLYTLTRNLYIYIHTHKYIYIHQMDCVCQRYHTECSPRTCAYDCYYC